MPITITMQEVDSSQIHSIGHDEPSNTLAVRFKNWKGEATSLYHYSNFGANEFAAFLDGESKGKHFSAHIKPHDKRYPYVRVE